MRGLALAVAFAASTASAGNLSELPPDDELQRQEIVDDGDRVGRVAAELGAALLGAALPNVLWLPFALSGSGSGAFAAMFVVAMALEPLSVATSTWLVHRKMKGHGLWPAAFGGAFLGAALGGGLFAMYGALSGFQLPTHYTVLAGAGGILLCVAATVLTLEIHHDQTVEASIAPIPGGAMAVFSGRL